MLRVRECGACALQSAVRKQDYAYNVRLGAKVRRKRALMLNTVWIVFFPRLLQQARGQGGETPQDKPSCNCSLPVSPGGCFLLRTLLSETRLRIRCSVRRTGPHLLQIPELPSFWSHGRLSLPRKEQKTSHVEGHIQQLSFL